VEPAVVPTCRVQFRRHDPRHRTPPLIAAVYLAGAQRLAMLPERAALLVVDVQQGFDDPA
jgi:hypothetical protein